VRREKGKGGTKVERKKGERGARELR